MEKEIHNIYTNYDLSFFPTLGENFGHVVWERLAFGCPVRALNLSMFGGGISFILMTIFNSILVNSTAVLPLLIIVGGYLGFLRQEMIIKYNPLLYDK